MKKAWLNQRYPYPLETPTALWARFRGNLIHKALPLTERRLALQPDGVILTGRIDYYDPETGLLIDYKTIASNPGKLAAPFPHHVQQMHLYTYLLTRKGYPVNKLAIVYLTMRDVVMFDVALPNLGVVEEKALDRVTKILAPEIPPPQPDEDWECRYCVYATKHC